MPLLPSNFSLPSPDARGQKYPAPAYGQTNAINHSIVDPSKEPNYEITPVVLAAEWASVSGEHVYLIVNMSEQEHKVTLPNKKQITVKALDAIRISK